MTLDHLLLDQSNVWYHCFSEVYTPGEECRCCLLDGLQNQGSESGCLPVLYHQAQWEIAGSGEYV